MSIVNQTDPAGAAQARLHRRSRSTRSSPTSTPTSRSSVPRTSAPEHLPVFACSMGDNVDPLLGPRPDDGGGPAVHLRRHLQDREHARGGHGRGRRAAPPATWQLGLKAVAIYRDNCKVGPAAVDGQEGRRHRPDQARGAAAAAGPAGRRADRREGRPRADPPEAAPAPPGHDLRVPGGRLQGLRQRRRVRGRPPGRDLPHGVEAGLDPVAGSWTPSPSRSATACSTACRCGPSSRRSPTCASSRPA